MRTHDVKIDINIVYLLFVYLLFYTTYNIICYYNVIHIIYE